MKVLLVFGILCLVLGLIPEPAYEPIKRNLRIAKVLHIDCTKECEIRDKEF